MASIDKKIVSLQLDNRNFESGAKTSMGTLDRLKKSLNFDSVGKAFSGISKAADEVDVSSLQSSVSKVSSGFSSLEVIAITALMNITSKAVDAGLQITKSLTVDPIAQGWGEYELKMGSIQTIMASTGEPLENVNKKLNELNEYSDRTIYSFSDMTTNIGKFTNAGVGLNQAVGAIQGISNAAALSGANANEASRAMYNFAQALSQGHVKLIDWKSIENANMATVEFKTQLMESAVAAGTLEKTADGMYRVLSTNTKGSTMKQTISATQGFNESLEHQWMTTEALISTLNNYADETTNIGKRAFAAAEDIKTMSQMMDALQESVGSGWAMIFETVIGDFEESKKLWTDIANVVSTWIGDMFDIRISMFQGWKDLGGRQALLDGLLNVFKALWNVITPLSTAFRNVFPRKTSEELYKNTMGFKNFSEVILKLSEALKGPLTFGFEIAFRVLKVFVEGFKLAFTGVKGLITILSPLVALLATVAGGFLHVVKTVAELIPLAQIIQKITEFLNVGISALAKGFNTLLGYLKPVGLAIGSVGTSSAEFAKAIAASIDYTNIFSSVLNKFKEISTVVSKKVEEVFAKLSGYIAVWSDKIKMSSETVTTGFTKATDTMTSSLEPFKKGLGTTWEVIKSTFGKLGEIMVAIGGVVKGVIDTIMRIMGQMFDGFTALDFENLFSVGVLTSVAISIKKFLDALSGPAKQLDKILESVTTVLDGVRKSLVSYQNSVKAKTLLMIAGAVGILTASIWVLSTLDVDKIVISLSTIGVMFAGLTIVMHSLSKLPKEMNAKGIKSLAVSMVLMATAVSILASALKKISTIEAGKLLTSLGAITVLITGMVALGAAASKMKADKEILKLSAAMVVFGLALNVMARSVKKLGGLDEDTLTKGLIALTIIITEMVIVSKLFNNPRETLTAAENMKALAVAIVIIAIAVRMIGGMDMKTLAVGLGTVGVAMAGLVFFSSRLPKDMLSRTSGLIGLATALVILAGALYLFGKMKLTTLAKGLLGIGGALTILSKATKAMDGVTNSLGLIAMAVALNLLVIPLIALSLIPFKKLVTSLLGLAGAILLFSGMTIVLSTIEPVLLAVAGSFALFGLAITGIGAGLLMISMSLTALGVGATAAAAGIIAVTGGVITSLTMFASALGTILSIVVTQIGKVAGSIIETVLKLLANILAAFVEQSPRIVQSLMEIFVMFASKFIEFLPTFMKLGFEMIAVFLQGVAEGLPQLITLLGEIVMNIISTFTEMMPDFVKIGIEFLRAMINGLTQIIPELMTLFSELVIAILKTLTDALPSLITAGVDFIVAFIKGISDNIGRVIAAGTDLLLKFMDGIAEAVPRAVVKIFETMITLINGIADAVEKYLPELIKAGANLVSAIVKGIVNGVLGGAGTISKNIGSIISNILSTISKAISSIWNKGKEIVTNIKNGIVSGVSGALGSIGSSIRSIITNVTKSISNAASSLLNSGKSIVSNVVRGITQGVANAASNIWNSAKSLGGKFLGGIKGALGIKSPARKLIEVMGFVAEGVVVGGKKMARKVADSGATMGRQMFDPIQAAMDTLIEGLDEDPDFNPKVVPVLDTTSFDSDLQEMNTSFEEMERNLSTTFDKNPISKSRMEVQRETEKTSNQNEKDSTTNITFNQTNNSPEALSTYDIYRKTQQQVKDMKKVVMAT